MSGTVCTQGDWVPCHGLLAGPSPLGDGPVAHHLDILNRGHLTHCLLSLPHLGVSQIISWDFLKYLMEFSGIFLWEFLNYSDGSFRNIFI